MRLLFVFVFLLNQTLFSQCTINAVPSQTNINCNGNNNGAAAVSITGGTYTYSWSNGATTTSITNLAPGNYSVAILSPSCVVSGIELVTNGNFSAGNSGFSSSYNYTPPPNVAAAQYWVGTALQVPTWNGGLASAGDHTSGTGNFMMVNGSGTANTNVWCQTIAVTPNTTYNFSTWVSSLYLISPAQLQFSINGSTIGSIFNAPATLNTWNQFFANWNSGINTTANICIVNQNTNSMGNDFGIDDISFQSCSSCSTTASFTITQPTALTVTATSTDAFCTSALGTASANVSGGTLPYTYSWSPGGQTTPNITVSTSGLQTITITDANNCTSSASTSVTIFPNPTTVISNNGPVCVNNNFTLTSSGGTNYLWQGSNGFTSTLQNPVLTASTTAMSGTYTVIVSAGTCSVAATTSVTINPLPTPTINANSPICLNNMLSLSCSGGSTYIWNGPNGFLSSAASPTLVANTTNYSGTYSVIATDINGCIGTANITITVNPIPDISIISSNNKGCAPLCVTFTFNSTSIVQSYNWSLGNGANGNTNNAQTCYNSQGTYTLNVSVTNTMGCSNNASYTVQVFPQPIADFNYAPLKPIINNDDVTFTDASHAATIQSWNWFFYSNALSTSNLQNPQFTYTEAGTYPVTLVVKTDKGCIDTMTKIIVIGEDYGIYVPNAFTPNDDGLNDIFQPKGYGIVKYQLQIFDRWGERIYETKTIEAGWDGKFRAKGIDYGKFYEEGSYAWLINVTNVFGKAHELKGHVTLIK